MLKSINAYLYLRHEDGLSEDELEIAKDFKQQNYRWKMFLSTNEIAMIGDWIILRRKNQRDLADSMRRNWNSMKKETTEMYDNEVMSYDLRAGIDGQLIDMDGPPMTEPECAIVYKTIVDSDMIAKPMSQEVIKKLAFLVVDIRTRMTVTFRDLNAPSPTPLYKIKVSDVKVHPDHIPMNNEHTLIKRINQFIVSKGHPKVTMTEENHIIGMILGGYEFGDKGDLASMMDTVFAYILQGRKRLATLVETEEMWDFSRGYGTIYCNGCGNEYRLHEHKQDCRFMQAKTEG